ncbi:hypothetical protein J2W42_002247 [Rhizobium tibeticum]|uniref:hypothetical protein n=1 Tax=Rhizobium tibeticum TaxID=501024 RepID=UPI002786340C|nr:hypothetical protein [Rhizobium tibeticum]MDP9809399.1 hypothetical protein [Rhizobium tibeticum]
MLDATICHIRDHRECDCKTGTCRQQIKAIQAPVHQFSVSEILSTAIVIGAIAAFFAFVSIPRAVGASHDQFLAQQESRNG